MAQQRIVKSFAPPQKEVRYLNKNFNEFRQALIDFARVYYPNTYTDFNETSPGSIFIEMASYIGDVLSYYVDNQFRENLLLYAEEQQNIVAIAQALGYKPRPATPATTVVDIFQICPASGSAAQFAPDTKYLLKLNPGVIVSSPQYQNVTFRTTQPVSFADETDREILVYSVDANNEPLTYLIKKKVPIVAGQIVENRFSVDQQAFSSVTLPEPNVTEILSLREVETDRQWFEVDYLAQDLIIENNENLQAPVEGTSIPPQSVLSLRREPRRFVTRYTPSGQLQIQFGSGVIDDTDESVSFDVLQIATEEYQTRLSQTPIDPSDFLRTKTYGLAPQGEFVVRYSVGGGIETNVPSNTITQINTITIQNDLTNLTAGERALIQDIINSVAVNNPFPATGGAAPETTDEIKQNAMAFFNAQGRAVTSDDYVVRCYSMPPRFGSVAKAYVVPDQQINQAMINSSTPPPPNGVYVQNSFSLNAINLYTLGYDRQGKLVPLNRQVKENLSRYLDQYRILTDSVTIMDAFPVNIAVEFKIIAFKNYNLNDVLAVCIDRVRNFFDISRWQINQPIILSDLVTEIATVEGVQSLIPYADGNQVRITNRYQFRDGTPSTSYNDYIYDLQVINGVIYPSIDPSIFELRYPDRDIIASATQ